VLLLGDVHLQGASAWQRAALVGASFALATITHFLIEQPVRTAPVLVLSPARSIAMGILITVAGALAGVGLKSVDGRAQIAIVGGLIIDPQTVRDDMPKLYRDGCHLDQLAKGPAPCVYGALDGSRTVVLFGDSHAAQWFPALETAARSAGWRLLSRTRSACPSIGVRIWNRQLNRELTECAEWRNAVLAEIARIKPDLVVLANYSHHRPIIDRFGQRREGEKRLHALREGELLVVEAIRSASNASLVLLRDIPYLPERPIDCLYIRRSERCAWPRHAVLGEDTFPFADYSGLDRISVLDLSDRVCGPDSCPALKDGLVVMRDRHHLTASFANSLAAQFEHLLTEHSTRQ
jgi:hypothetical protein